MSYSLEQRLINFWDDIPYCCGYPDCDGDLEGMEHSETCDLHGKEEIPLRRNILTFVRYELFRAAEIAHNGWNDVCEACDICETAKNIENRIRKLAE